MNNPSTQTATPQGTGQSHQPQPASSLVVKRLNICDSLQRTLSQMETEKMVGLDLTWDQLLTLDKALRAYRDRALIDCYQLLEMVEWALDVLDPQGDVNVA